MGAGATHVSSFSSYFPFFLHPPHSFLLSSLSISIHKLLGGLGGPMDLHNRYGRGEGRAPQPSVNPPLPATDLEVRHEAGDATTKLIVDDHDKQGNGENDVHLRTNARDPEHGLMPSQSVTAENGTSMCDAAFTYAWPFLSFFGWVVVGFIWHASLWRRAWMGLGVALVPGGNHTRIKVKKTQKMCGSYK